MFDLTSETQTRAGLRAIAYLRVSTDEQSESGLGLAAQREAIRACAERLGAEIAETDWFSDEGISGGAGLEDRPGLLGAMDALGTVRQKSGRDREKNGAVLIVAKRDRLARDKMLAAYLDLDAKRRGARIISAAGEGTASDDPTDVLLRGVVDLFAEYERHVIRWRTKAALASKRRNGHRAGTVPYGFQLDPTDLRQNKRGQLVPYRLVEVPDEQRVIAEIRRLRGLGKSYGTIARRLTYEKVRTKKGGSVWTRQAVESVYLRAQMDAET